MLVDPILRRDVQQSESCRLTAYLDTNGFWTIGYGHKLPVGHDWTGYAISTSQADAMLDGDIFEASLQAQKLPEWIYCDTRARCNALVELVFNIGINKWRTFTRARAGIKAQNWKTVSDELKDSLWYTQVHPTRGDRLRDYFLTGCYPPLGAESLLYVSSSSAWPAGSVPAAT